MHVLRTAFAAATITAMACAVAGAYPSNLKIKLYAQNRPGKTGTATFEQTPAGVEIVVTMAGGQNGTQPIHIHTGTCEKLNPVATYTLTDIVQGSRRQRYRASASRIFSRATMSSTSMRTAPT